MKIMGVEEMVTFQLKLSAHWGGVQEEIKLKQQLAQPLNELQETAEMIATTSAECKIDVDADEYMQSFKPTMMDIIDKWSKVSSYACQKIILVSLCN